MTKSEDGYFYLENEDKSIYSYTDKKQELLDKTFLENFVSKFYTETADNFLDANFDISNFMNTQYPNDESNFHQVVLTLPDGKTYTLKYEYYEKDSDGNDCKLISEYENKTKTLLIFNRERKSGGVTGSDYFFAYKVGSDGRIVNQYNQYDIKKLVVEDIQPKFSVNIDQKTMGENVNNIREKLNIYLDIEKQEEITYESSASILQSSIATWYKVLRRIALVGLLSILVYVGIRIILTSISADKAKYKKMFIDWLVAICILFVLHYLIVLILTLSTKLSEVFEKAGAYQMTYVLPADTKIEGTKITDMNKEEIRSITDDDEYSKIIVEVDENGKAKPVWSGEFVGYIRLKAGSHFTRNQMAYGLMYLVLVIYICMFTFMYLRRALYMAFLTMISPLIALTYPLDKIKDGQAQAFGMWIREFIFNALIQPVHLIIYTMTISTAISLAEQHPVYALVALGFMLPAEKFIRNMFGFQKAETVSPLGGAVGGAALMTAVGKLSKLGRKKKDNKDENKNGKIRTADKDRPTFDLPEVNTDGATSNAVGAGAASQNSTIRTQSPITRKWSKHNSNNSASYKPNYNSS